MKLKTRLIALGSIAEHDAAALAARFGAAIVGVEALRPRAAERIRNGEADGVLVADDGWVRIEAVADPRDSAGRAESVARTLGPVTTAFASAVAPAGTRKPRARRQRPGPRPHKPSREHAQLVADLLAEGLSLQAIAEELNRSQVPTPTGKGKWYPATVRRMLDAGVHETRTVLRRLGGLLADLESMEPVNKKTLHALGDKHLFHADRLLLAFERGWGKPYDTPYQRPVQRDRDGYRVSPGGRALLDRWRKSDQLDDRIERVLHQLWREGGAATPERYQQVCGTHGIAPGDVADLHVQWDSRSGQFVVTEEGLRSAETWDGLVNDDPRKRIDIDFWPEPREERALRNSRWDWAESPLNPAE